jgi:hypothetical protein
MWVWVWVSRCVRVCGAPYHLGPGSLRLLLGCRHLLRLPVRRRHGPLLPRQSGTCVTDNGSTLLPRDPAVSSLRGASRLWPRCGGKGPRGRLET